MFWLIVIAIVILIYIYFKRRDSSRRTSVGTQHKPAIPPNEPATPPRPTYKQRINTPRDEEPPLDQIDLNEDFTRGYDFMESTRPCVFVTGKPGTGKSTLLRYFKQKTAKRFVVLAPTGIAAINVGGQTIHSFFRFPPRPINPDDIQPLPNAQKRKLYEALDAIVIDEVSMVRADVMDGIDQFMRKNGKNRTLPFGGTQMIFVGDLFQLPPVVAHREEAKMFAHRWVSPYFFSAHVLREINMEMVELTKIYRQTDRDFIDMLSALRVNKCDDDVIERLNRRYQPEFTPKQDDFFITLTSTNALAADINEKKLNSLPAERKEFKGRIEGNFKTQDMPTDLTLYLKENAQVMFVKNDKDKRWVNGTLGKVLKIAGQNVEVEIAGGYRHRVQPVGWEIVKYRYDEETRRIISEVTGSFTQLPLKLAWAITIHKSQGKTLDNVIIDLGSGAFAHGQLYVALSRCRTLGGIVLKTRVKPSDVIVDQRVVDFHEGWIK
jgi:tRNA uridine 5-carbamoylmethylation protein Kti12